MIDAVCVDGVGGVLTAFPRAWLARVRATTPAEITSARTATAIRAFVAGELLASRESVSNAIAPAEDECQRRSDEDEPAGLAPFESFAAAIATFLSQPAS